MTEAAALVDTDECGFLGGRLRLRQFRCGHRAGTDAVLLAAATQVRPGDHLVDVGAGVGAAALAVLCRVPDITATLIEKDGPTADLARHNVVTNGFGARARVVALDIFDKSACRTCLGRPADVAMSNPPFFAAGTVRASAHKGSAHVLSDHTHADWLLRVAAVVRPGGRFVMIHRPDVLAELLHAMPRVAGQIRLRAVHATAGQAAMRLLVSGEIGSRAPLSIAPALVLHGPDGKFTPDVQAVHTGHAVF